ncbi:T9SS type A sorting domain-containing protein [uncultured Psychroserpens sp.]|uniref:T9SS type A sorting domain-containing protein n=1 Tax=uncultured Psychroserpens sp. TaxID=255436 RepID=UPI00262198C0|nr:T9SS type A sorting domain-containing protein [uncultured Psychroserpens sp.]
MMLRIKKRLALLILTGTVISIQGQVQIGDDIDGLSAGNLFGNKTSISSDGTVVACVGIGNAGGQGNIRVFKNNNGVWSLYGTDQNGANFEGIGAYDVSLSADGNTLAIGGWSNAVRLYTYDAVTGFWTQKGNIITNNTGVGTFGYSVSLSADGNKVIIGIPGLGTPPPPESGIIQIFEYNSGTWSQLGNNIEGSVFAGHSGLSVNASSDGNRIVIANYDSVFIYENIAGQWTQLGNEIIGDNVSGLDISDVAISSDGNTVAVGEPDYSDAFIQRGRVRVFNYESGIWHQIGSAIMGEIAYYRTGWSVSLSSNGDILAIGEIGSMSGSTDKGRTRIFKNVGGFWSQIGTNIFGEANEDYSGWSVSLSEDASTLAIGASRNDGNGDNSGHTRIYNLSALLSVNDLIQSQISMFPNPAKEEVTIELNDATTLNTVNIYNSLGKLIRTVNNLIIDTSKLASGLYYVEIKTNLGKATKKLVIQ